MQGILKSLELMSEKIKEVEVIKGILLLQFKGHPYTVVYK